MSTKLYWIQGPWRGKLAMAAHPRGGDWLDDEISSWRRAGIDAVVSLLTPEEESDLDLGREPQVVKAQGVTFLSFPIPDYQVPTSQTEMTAVSGRIEAELSAGRNVVVHCRQGVGRSGLLAACLLITKGLSSGAAIDSVTAARGAPIPETDEQRHWIERFALVTSARLIWPHDDATQIAARAFPLPISSRESASEYEGHKIILGCWQSCLRAGDTFSPSPVIWCSPAQIIAEFRVAHNLQALALTASWGNMGRTKRFIYQKSLQEIYDALASCSQSIRQTSSIKDSWELLTTKLLWTNVMTSKTLYFLCRALGFNQNPPVPIDNKVMLKKVWPTFSGGVPASQRPGNWEGRDFDAYCRYMTAVIEWAQPTHRSRQWSTIDVQATIFEEYGNNKAGNATSCGR